MLLQCNPCNTFVASFLHYVAVTPYSISSTSTSWGRRGLKMVPRSDLDSIIHCAFLRTCAGTIIVTLFVTSLLHPCDTFVIAPNLKNPNRDK